MKKFKFEFQRTWDSYLAELNNQWINPRVAIVGADYGDFFVISVEGVNYSLELTSTKRVKKNSLRLLDN